MTINPVESVPVPGYPDKYSEEAKQALVASHPLRWQGAPLLVGVLSAAVAFGVGGCDTAPFATAGVPMPIPMPFEEGIGGSDYVETVKMFVPLFEYGEGTGAIGCVSISAPNFMSEEEAFAILSSNLEEAGLELGRNAAELMNVTIPITDFSPIIREDKLPVKTKKGNLVTDELLGINHSLLVKFVSTRDLDNWQGKQGVSSTVQVYNIKEAAQTLADSNPGLVVFYDPVAMPDIELLWALEQREGESEHDYRNRRSTAYAEAEQAARAESAQLLRYQAEAFIAWLQAEGLY